MKGWQLLGKGYRAYHPKLMRFSRPDDLSPFDKGGTNAYVYCGGDPVNHVDPSGAFLISAVLKQLTLVGRTIARAPRTVQHEARNAVGRLFSRGRSVDGVRRRASIASTPEENAKLYADQHAYYLDYGPIAAGKRKLPQSAEIVPSARSVSAPLSAPVLPAAGPSGDNFLLRARMPGNTDAALDPRLGWQRARRRAGGRRPSTVAMWEAPLARRPDDGPVGLVEFVRSVRGVPPDERASVSWRWKP